jgi:transposase
MNFQKTIRIPIHYDTTKIKIGILDRLTARITYGIRLISGLMDETTDLDRTTLDKLIKNSDIVEKTGLSAGFIQQCRDKVIWTWKSYHKLHRTWERQAASAEKRVVSARDDKELKKRQKYLEKVLKKEPSTPDFRAKTPCRLDSRTGKVTEGKGKLSPLWIHISTLEKGKTIDVPLNPSRYHLNQLKAAEKIDDFEIIKRNKKYYVHITITRVIEDQQISSIGGIDQGLNRSLAVVLLETPIPREELILDAAKRELLDKYDKIISSLQEAKMWDKLRELRHKRSDVAMYHDWCLAIQTAEATKGNYIAIGNAPFGQTQFRGNGMPKLRKRIGKWSFSRQRKYIVLKRAELGYPTKLREEYGTSKECHFCGSKLITRKWLSDSSYILCHSCNSKEDADINGAYNIAFRCQDDWLKAQMNMKGEKPHAST